MCPCVRVSNPSNGVLCLGLHDLDPEMGEKDTPLIWVRYLPL